jgi:hypothetical protein
MSPMSRLDWLDLLLVTATQRQLEKGLAAAARDRIRDKAQLATRVEQLERDLGSVSLVARTLADLCLRKGVFSAEEFEAQFREADLADGVGDGRLDPKVVKPGEQQFAQLTPITDKTPRKLPPHKRRR